MMRTHTVALLLSIVIGIALIAGLTVHLGVWDSPTDEPASAEPAVPGTPGGARTVVPQAGEGMRLSGAVGSETDEDVRVDQPAVQIPLDSGELLVDVLDTNLTRNEFEEQVVAYKRSDDPDDLVRLRVIEANISEGGHRVVWEAATSATSVRSLNLSTEDVFGDGEPEIVVIGVDAEGNQTLDIFRREGPVTALSYAPVASITSTGSVELVRHERDSDDEEITDPWEILAQSENTDTDNILDVVETRYRFDASQDEYIEYSREEISGGDIAEAQLQELYQSGSTEFARFLSGLWYREEGSGLQLVTFNPDGEQLVFNGGEMQESFDWEVSRKTVSSGIQISMRNRNIRSLNTFVRVQVRDLETITVDVNDRDRWDGTYRRVSDSLRQSLTGTSGGHVELSDMSLEGTYQDDRGIRLDFDGTRFSLREDGRRMEGGFALYKAGERVLEMAMLDERGRKQERRIYIVDLQVDELADRIVRTLRLSPARLTVGGAQHTGGETISLERIELIEEEATSDDELASDT